jgi:hypothetical protein
MYRYLGKFRANNIFFPEKEIVSIDIYSRLAILMELGMQVVLYQDSSRISGSSGGIQNFFKSLEKDPQLWTMVHEIYKKVQKSQDLGLFERNGIVKRLHGVSKPIYEFRIPQTNRKGGVARLYFGYKKNSADKIVILSAEIKDGKTKSDKTKIQQAIQRYKEVCE